MGLLQTLKSFTTKYKWRVEKDLLHDDLRTIATAIDNDTPAQTYIEVDISSDEILAKDTIQLLPAGGAGTYYDISKMIFEYTHVTTAYTSATNAIEIAQGADMALVNDDLIKSAFSQASVVTSFGTPYNLDISGGELQNSNVAVSLNTVVECFWYDGGAITSGDGTIKVKIWYTLRTLGTEL